jgi:uncharacterized protein
MAREKAGAGTRELVEALYEAFSVRDLDAVLALIDRDFDFRPVATSELTNQASYNGHAGMRRYFNDIARVWAELRLVPQNFRPAGEKLVVLGRVYARTVDGAIADSPTGWVWEARSGKLTRCTIYRSHAEALKAAGLEE